MRHAILLVTLLWCGTSLATDPTPREPTGPSVDQLVARAHLLSVKQDWTQAEEVFRTALEQNPERADAWRGLGYVLRKQGHGSDARVAYEKALALAPTDPDTLLGLGETYVAVDRTPDAKLLLERLRAVDRRHAATLDHIIKSGTPR